MIYSVPTFSSTLTILKRGGHCLLALPLCVLLIGCDSASSNQDKGLTTKIASIDYVEENSSQVAAENLAKTNLLSAGSELDIVAEGQSLIAAAQSSNDAHLHQSLTYSKSHNNALQATLMGDYGGMVPCNSCDSTDITLNLFANGSVLKTSIYNNPETPRLPLIESGVYRQDNDTITIVYEEKNIEAYHIQDNHLVLMDEYKNPNNDYTLSRK
ncbi:copper resistance protein NlpE N-terminal domain-containing protein [Psychrobacter aquimaris]|uniref:copper resistance protein NlpE N-terminal domain-containing protein n=1 Tax=Psychrobacter aquimaris TaxID=292733 RepID=UPI003FD3FC50